MRARRGAPSARPVLSERERETIVVRGGAACRARSGITRNSRARRSSGFSARWFTSTARGRARRRRSRRGGRMSTQRLAACPCARRALASRLPRAFLETAVGGGPGCPRGDPVAPHLARDARARARATLRRSSRPAHRSRRRQARVLRRRAARLRARARPARGSRCAKNRRKRSSRRNTGSVASSPTRATPKPPATASACRVAAPRRRPPRPPAMHSRRRRRRAQRGKITAGQHPRRRPRGCRLAKDKHHPRGDPRGGHARRRAGDPPRSPGYRRS